eukprot:3223768-Karenia_brevis.AAC.1
MGLMPSAPEGSFQILIRNAIANMSDFHNVIGTIPLCVLSCFVSTTLYIERARPSAKRRLPP